MKNVKNLKVLFWLFLCKMYCVLPAWCPLHLNLKLITAKIGNSELTDVPPQLVHIEVLHFSHFCIFKLAIVDGKEWLPNTEGMINWRFTV